MASASPSSYVIIMPVRNEAGFLEAAIGSVVSQTVRPAQLVIVDDGSSDGSGRIAKEAAAKHEWIEVAHRPDRGFRAPGGGVMEAFYEGYRRLHSRDWRFLVKLDGDLTFEPQYFENCFRHFVDDPRLGIGGGTICRQFNGELLPEAPGDPAFHVRGATKIYRRECWDALGGLIRQPGWDTVDEYRANMLGWVTYTFPELKLWHHRPAGGAQGTWRNWMKNGLANYVAGYHPLFMGCKCARRLFARPYGVMALGLLAGFLSGYLRRIPRVADKDLLRYVRRQQLRKLLFRQSLWDRAPLNRCCARFGP